MYSHKKGKSGSTKPSAPQPKGWCKYKGKEVELLVVKYSKEGKKPSQIGVVLRDKYGIPDVKIACGKSVITILKEKSLSPDIPEDLMALIRKSIHVRKHLEENIHDYTAKRGLQLTESKINRLVKYYLANNTLPSGWKYDPEKVKLLVD